MTSLFEKQKSADEEDAAGGTKAVEHDVLNERRALGRQALMELIKDGDRVRERPGEQECQPRMESRARHRFDEKCPECEEDGEMRRFPNQELDQADAPFRLERYRSSGVLEVDGREDGLGPRPIDAFER